MQAAIDAGADAFFDEKYGETVRTIRVEGYSHELCGGTHVRATGQIGGFVITGERSIGSGTRRIEALTGAAADMWLRARFDGLAAAAEMLGATSADTVPDRIRVLQEELRDAKRRLRAGGGGAGAALPKAGELASRAETLDGDVRLVAFAGPYESIDALKGAAKDLRGVLGSGVIALGLDADEPQLFVTVSDDLVGRGIAAGELVREAMTAIDGRGGGRPEMAQGKGTRRDGLAAALDNVRSRLIRAG